MQGDHEPRCAPTVLEAADFAEGSALHPTVRSARLVLASVDDMNSGILAEEYNVGLCGVALWTAARSLWGQGLGQVGGVAAERRQ